MRIRRILAAVVALWLTAIGIACVYTPHSRLTPHGAISPKGEFAGVYCFSVRTVTEREYSASDPAIVPFFGIWPPPEGSTLQITQDATSIVTTIIEQDGTTQTHRFDFAAQGGGIANGVLTVHPYQLANPFGWYRTRRTSTMYRLADGRLVMTDEHTYTGLACALVPTHERSETVVTLKPGACAP